MEITNIDNSVVISHDEKQYTYDIAGSTLYDAEWNIIHHDNWSEEFKALSDAFDVVLGYLQFNSEPVLKDEEGNNNA